MIFGNGPIDQPGVVAHKKKIRIFLIFGYDVDRYIQGLSVEGCLTIVEEILVNIGMLNARLRLRDLNCNPLACWLA